MVRFWYRFADEICSRDLLTFVLLPTNDVSVKLKLDLKVQVITNKLIAIAEQLESWVASTDVTIIEIEIAFLTENRIELKS